MEIRHLRYFVALAEELHFGRAAERLHISQPPLSQQIRALEDELACQLFERTNRSVALTDAGRLFLGEARQILQHAERAKQAAARAHLGELGEISLSMFPSAPLVPEVIAFLKHFRRVSPGVRITLRERASNDVLIDLEQGRADAAFVRYARLPPLPDGFIAQSVVSEPFMAVMSKDHPMATRKSPIRLSTLAHESFIHFPMQQHYALSFHFHELCHEAGFRPKMVHEANDISMIVALIGAGFGISVLPRSISRLNSLETHCRELSEPAGRSLIWLVHAAAPRQPLIRNLVEQYAVFCAKNDS